LEGKVGLGPGDLDVKEIGVGIKAYLAGERTIVHAISACAGREKLEEAKRG
jgi:hypothetical protein